MTNTINKQLEIENLKDIIYNSIKNHELLRDFLKYVQDLNTNMHSSFICNHQISSCLGSCLGSGLMGTHQQRAQGKFWVVMEILCVLRIDNSLVIWHMRL